MTIEDDLAEAMAAHTADVQAPPDLGRSVRHRHRAHVVRLRVAGAALLTAAVAVALPMTLNPAEPAATANPAIGEDRAVMRTDVIVPDVTGKRVTDAAQILRDAGLVTDVQGAEVRNYVVLKQAPAAGKQVTPGSHVRLTLLPPYKSPQDLGDLGDGRKFGGIEIGYLPGGLEWGKWSGKDRFGKHTYTTTFDRPENNPGVYSVQVIVYEDEAAKRVYDRFPADGSETVDIGDKKARLATLSDSGEVMPHGTPTSALTIAWELSDGLAVKVFFSPGYAKELDGPAELKKIAEGIKAIK
ncbi:PASTA domain-containing protein [Nonomuraea sp. NPDC046802]|uniref:PASTA domain-containing protein n=1 Tax=Nonomuraea sp. NPDC046802 TaxID=3154919 RepID=UPI0033E839DB